MESILGLLKSLKIRAQESIPPAYVAERVGTINRVVVPAHQAGNQYLGSLKGSKPVFLNVYGAQESFPRNEFRQSM